MTGTRRAYRARLVALSPVLALVLSACFWAGKPDTVFGAHSEFGHEIDGLTRLLMYLGVVVFVLVEALLVVILIRYRRRPANETAMQIHGNTTLEVTWTAIPAVILAIIAVPTVRTIFHTQAAAQPGAMQVEVIGHQWWWEFRYPQYGVVTANELYLPLGHTANFALKTADVLHSFWPPNVAGKRDLITNHTNYIWWTPDSAGVYNGFCAEYCGASHSNMRFRVFVVTPPEFDAWVAHQKEGPAIGAPAAGAAAAPTPPVAQVAPSTGGQTPAGGAAQPPTGTPVITASAQVPTFPRDKLPAWSVPSTPTPADLHVDANVQGDAQRGAALFKTAACIACHTVQGVSPGVIGPNLTHVGSRTTIAGGLYPNDMHHLMLWIKNAPAMKPGSLMPALGQSATVPSGYTDQQIADLAAYLTALK